MSATAFYVWFILNNTTFPWQHDALNTAEYLGLFVNGSLWVLC